MLTYSEREVACFIRPCLAIRFILNFAFKKDLELWECGRLRMDHVLNWTRHPDMDELEIYLHISAKCRLLCSILELLLYLSAK